MWLRLIEPFLTFIFLNSFVWRGDITEVNVPVDCSGGLVELNYTINISYKIGVKGLQGLSSLSSLRDVHSTQCGAQTASIEDLGVSQILNCTVYSVMGKAMLLTVLTAPPIRLQSFESLYY